MFMILRKASVQWQVGLAAASHEAVPLCMQRNGASSTLLKRLIKNTNKSRMSLRKLRTRSIAMSATAGYGPRADLLPIVAYNKDNAAKR